MEAIRFDRVTFSYPMAETPALADVSFDVEESEFLLVCGKSGCGKTTLLRQIKKNLIPYGQKSGTVTYYGQPVDQLDDRISAARIGFVQQDPDNQIVTDKVWHELAFGLESLGMDGQSIRRRVAEMTGYFDIQGWFRKDVSRLSGGQKQLLNLASIMVMQPKLIVLDEPTSQLDPIAASEFLQTLRKINRDLGVTVILSEHRLEEAFAMADRVMVMDGGRVLACDTPGKIGRSLAQSDHPMFHGLPAVTKIYHSVTAKPADVQEPVATDEKWRVEERDAKATAEGPVTVREGRLWLKELIEGKGSPETAEPGKGEDVSEKKKVSSAGGSEVNRTGSHEGSGPNDRAEPSIEIRDLWFRYDKKSNDVLRDMSLRVYAGEFYGLMGGNGAGKTTALKALMGILEPQRGRVRTRGSIAMLPQNPQALFSEITAEDELLDVLGESKKSDREKVMAVTDMLRLLEIEHLRQNHPYDLSGGEQQRLALGKVLLLEPEILLLDEPTKGLDPFFKVTLAGILDQLKSRGMTVLAVSHDIEFCAQYADRCGMLFDGNVVSEGDGKEFFAGNSFYTTTANRVARDYFPHAVTWEEVAGCIRSLR